METDVRKNPLFLSPSDILRFRSLKRIKLPRNGGVKEHSHELVNSDRSNALQLVLSQREAALKIPRIISLKNAYIGVLNPGFTEVVVISKYGHNSRFDSEIAIFLVECGQMEIRSPHEPSMPLSVRQLYHSIFMSRYKLEHYYLYTYLSRLGFFLERLSSFRMLPLFKTVVSNSTAIAENPIQIHRKEDKNFADVKRNNDCEALIFAQKLNEIMNTELHCKLLSRRKIIDSCLKKFNVESGRSNVSVKNAEKPLNDKERNNLKSIVYDYIKHYVFNNDNVIEATMYNCNARLERNKSEFNDIFDVHLGRGRKKQNFRLFHASSDDFPSYTDLCQASDKHMNVIGCVDCGDVTFYHFRNLNGDLVNFDAL